ncbi:hypothetical protein VTI74DRAFT_11248 [Chaetomium olivicolor]
MKPLEEVRDDGLDLQAGFEISPFSSPVITLEFANGFPLTIHRSFLLQCSKLGLLCDASTKTIDLKMFSSNAGHALVQYLYTGSIGILKWTGPLDPLSKINLAEVKAWFEIYALSRTVELDDFEASAKDGLELITRDIDVFTVFDAVKESYPKPIGNDVWFPQWMKSRVKEAFKDPGSLLRNTNLPDFSDGPSVVKVFFDCMLEAYIEMLESLAGQHVVAGEPDTPLTEHSFGRRRFVAHISTSVCIGLTESCSIKALPEKVVPLLGELEKPSQPGLKPSHESAQEPEITSEPPAEPETEPEPEPEEPGSELSYLPVAPEELAPRLLGEVYEIARVEERIGKDKKKKKKSRLPVPAHTPEHPKEPIPVLLSDERKPEHMLRPLPDVPGPALESEPKSDPAPAVAEKPAEDDLWALPSKKKKKKPKKAVESPEEERIIGVAEPRTPSHDPEEVSIEDAMYVLDRDPWDFWGVSRGRKSPPRVSV